MVRRSTLMRILKLWSKVWFFNLANKMSQLAEFCCWTLDHGSTLWYLSMQGMTKKIPGPFAPPDLNRPSLMKPFLESNVLFNNPVILYTSQIKVRATPDHNHKFLPKDDCSLVLLNHLKQTQSKIGRWYKVKIYLFVVVVLKIKTLRQVQSEKGRKRRMRDREREARTKPKMPLPSSSSSTSSLIDNPFLTSSSLRSRFSSGW